MFRLRLEITGATGPAVVTELALQERETVSVGRQGCELLLQDRTVSRKHLGFGVKHGRLVAGDLGSTAGTLHNGKPFRRGKAHKGDLFQLGTSTILILSFELVPETAGFSLSLLIRRLIPRSRRVWAMASGLALALFAGYSSIETGTRFDPNTSLFVPKEASLSDVGNSLKSMGQWVQAKAYAFKTPDPTREEPIDYEHLFED